MASVARRVNAGASTHWLVKGLRFTNQHAQIAALTVLYELASSRPDYDLATDSRSRQGILVLSDADFTMLVPELQRRGIPYQEVPVKPMSDLPPDLQRHARGLMR